LRVWDGLDSGLQEASAAPSMPTGGMPRAGVPAQLWRLVGIGVGCFGLASGCEDSFEAGCEPEPAVERDARAVLIV
jgi:hypothetical protein